MMLVHIVGLYVGGWPCPPLPVYTTERVSVNVREWSNSECRIIQGVRLDGRCLLYVIPVRLCVYVSICLYKRTFVLTDPN